MHGEARHLKAQAELARELGAQDGLSVLDGEIARLAPDPAVIDDAPVGRLFRDGRLLVPEADGPVRARRKLAAVGIVVVACACRGAASSWASRRPCSTACPTRPPTARRCSMSCSTPSTARCAASRPRRARRPTLVAEAVRRAVRAAVNEAWGKKPICKVLVNVVDSRG